MKNIVRSKCVKEENHSSSGIFCGRHFPRNLQTKSHTHRTEVFQISILNPFSSTISFPSGMSFLRPFMLCSSLRWMTCQSWGFPRWPGFDGFLRFLVLLILWSMLLEIHSIPSSSMYPTLRVGDRFLVEKASYYITSPSIDDIITFRDPTQQSERREESVVVKRVVAKAGDMVEVCEGCLYVNGISKDESFLAERPTYTTKSTQVPEGHVYVLGDNRNNSYDSHIWGPLPIKNIIGRYLWSCHKPTS